MARLAWEKASSGDDWWWLLLLAMSVSSSKSRLIRSRPVRSSSPSDMLDDLSSWGGGGVWGGEVNICRMHNFYRWLWSVVLVTRCVHVVHHHNPVEKVSQEGLMWRSIDRQVEGSRMSKAKPLSSAPSLNHVRSMISRTPTQH